jgi:glycosyltransferase involved in cell wall biosynthesis
MKIIYLVPDLDTKGGIQQLARTIAKDLNPDQVAVLKNWDNPLNIVKYAILSLSPNFIAERLYSKWLRVSNDEYIKTVGDADVVHYWDVKVAMSHIEQINRPFVVSCHGLEILKTKIRPFQRKLFLRTLNQASEIIGGSNFTKDHLVIDYGIESLKVKMITPTVDSSLLKVGTSRNKEKPNDVLNIGTLSRFVKRKNIPNIIKALEILKNEYNRNFNYILAGDGPQKKVILDELNKASFRWEYLGLISDDEKFKKYYPSLDIFVMPPLSLPSDVEGFGIVYLEANAYGMPVVAADTGGVSDAVKDGKTGIFANPMDPNSIAKSLDTIISNGINTYRKDSLDWVKHFTSDRIAIKYSKIYKKIST